MAANNYHKYDEDFKKSLVSLHQNGKAQSQLCKEYGVSQLSWICLPKNHRMASVWKSGC